MGGYTMAWLVILAMAAGGGLTLWQLLRRIQSVTLKSVLVALTIFFFVTPAPIPGHPGEFAPAFVVGIFEAFFQIDGRPSGAFLALAAGLVLGAIGAGMLGRWLQRRQTAA